VTSNGEAKLSGIPSTKIVEVSFCIVILLSCIYIFEGENVPDWDWALWEEEKRMNALLRRESWGGVVEEL